MKSSRPNAIPQAQHPGLRDALQPTTGGNPSSEPENGFTRSTQSDCHGLKLVARLIAAGHMVGVPDR